MMMAVLIYCLTFMTIEITYGEQFYFFIIKQMSNMTPEALLLLTGNINLIE